MTSFDSPNGDPSTSEEFANALTTLLRAADCEDIDVCGGYRIECDHDQDIGVEVYRVLPRDN